MTGLGKEYGDAIYELARDENQLAEIHAQLNELRELFNEFPAFVKLLTSRAIEREERLAVVDRTVGGQGNRYLVNFMKLLVEKERFDCFMDAAQRYHERFNEDFGIVEAQVVSAVPLSQAEREALLSKLEVMSGRRVALFTRVDPSVIGGLRVEMEGRRYDNTIENKMSRLKQSMAQGL